MRVSGTRFVPALWLLLGLGPGCGCGPLRALAAGSLVVSVTDYGAKPDDGSPTGLQRCTQAFRKALADVAAAGGGTLRVPSGTFHVGPLNLTSNLVLWLAAGATLKADTNPKRVPLLPALPAYGPGGKLQDAKRRAQQFMRPQADLRDAIPRHQPLLYGRGLRNVTVTGENGTLDGQGVDWWRRWLNEPLFGRPHLVEFERSRGIILRNVTLRNPGFWAVHLWLCEYVTAQFVTILVTPWSPLVRPTNTDGINPDSSSHVLIEDAYLQTGDDSVAVKSGWDCFGRRVGTPARNITIRRVVVRQTRGCNAAAFTIGSEMSGGVEDVFIEDCHVINAGVGVEVKVGAGRGGFVRGVRVRNIEIEETSRGALVVMALYPERNPFCLDPNPPAPVVSGISFEDVRVLGPTRGKLVQMQGTPEVPLRDLSVRGLRGKGTWLCTLAFGNSSDNDPTACPSLRPEDAEPEPSNWRNDGRCGQEYPEGNGGPGRCPTEAEFAAEAGDPSRASAEPWLEGSPCCSAGGWCGGKEEHCTCPECVDYRHRPRPSPAPPPVAPQQQQPPAEPMEAESPEDTDGRAKPDGLQVPLLTVSLDHLRAPVEPPAQGLITAGMLGLCAVLCLLLSRRSGPLSPKNSCCKRNSGACVASLAALAALQQLLSVLRPPSPSQVAPAQEAVGSRPAASSATSSPPVSSSASVEGADRSGCWRGDPVGPLMFGAKGNGVVDDTAAVRAALEYGTRCRASVVLGPKRQRFLVSPNGLQLQLRDVTVRFEGRLLGPSLKAWNPKLESWPRGSCAYAEAGCSSSSSRSPEFARSQWSLLHLKDSSNISLVGPGGIQAPGRSFWNVRNARPGVRGYCLLKLDRSQDVRVSGLTLKDSPMYQVVVMHSRDVDLSGLRIAVADNHIGDAGPHNTDGVSIIASEAVRLRDSEIESGDDNVVIKEGSRGIFAEGLLLRRGKGISIGSLGERGTQDQVVTDVHFRDVSLQQCVHGARIKTWQGGQGLVRNVSFESFRLRAVSVGILIDQTYCPPSQRPEGCADGGDAAIRIEDVHFRRFSGTVTKEERKILCVRCGGIEYDDIALTREFTPEPPRHPWPPARKRASDAQVVRKPPPGGRLRRPALAELVQRQRRRDRREEP